MDPKRNPWDCMDPNRNHWDCMDPLVQALRYQGKTMQLKMPVRCCCCRFRKSCRCLPDSTRAAAAADTALLL